MIDYDKERAELKRQQPLLVEMRPKEVYKLHVNNNHFNGHLKVT